MAGFIQGAKDNHETEVRKDRISKALPWVLLVNLETDARAPRLLCGFVYFQNSVDGDVAERLHRASWPEDFDRFDRRFLAQAKM